MTTGSRCDRCMMLIPADAGSVLSVTDTATDLDVYGEPLPAEHCYDLCWQCRTDLKHWLTGGKPEHGTDSD